MTEAAPVTGTSRKVWIELFVISILSLYLELLAIKWLSADIRALSIFRSYPLIACFVGFGIGYALKDNKLFGYTPFAILQLAATIKLAEWCGLAFLGFPSATVFQFSVTTIGGLGQWGNLVFFMLLLIMLLAAPFGCCVCVGARIGILFDELPALPAYAVNLIGALAGSILFTALSFLGLSPSALLVVPILIVIAYLWQKSQIKSSIGMAVALILAPLIALCPSPNESIPLYENCISELNSQKTTLWSPYQRLDVSNFDFKNPVPALKSSFLGLELGTNRSFYQYFFNPNIDPATPGLPAPLAQLLAERESQYSFPMKVHPSKDVLIVGAGVGQDAAKAVQMGATSVDAVEIDPVIINVGKKYDPYYADPKIHVINDDARHFLRTTNKKYDLVCFTLLDSHTVAGLGSSVRLDAYVYTRESIQSALNKLKPDGMLTLAFAVGKDYIADRLFYTMKDAAGYAPMVVAEKKVKLWGAPFYLLGNPVKENKVQLPQGWQASGIPYGPPIKVLTDDWPYLYLDTSVVDVPYLLVMAEALLICLFVCRKILFSKPGAIYFQMFFLGAGFLLMELTSIAKLSLLFGSTWLTSAIVINGILILIFFANILVIKQKPVLTKHSTLLYVLLFAALLLDYFLPTSSLIDSASGFGGNALVTFLVIFPISIAGLIFPVAFAQVESPPKGLTFNILGAVVGGFLEYLSNFLGVQSLILVALGLYLISFLFATQAKKVAPPAT